MRRKAYTSKFVKSGKWWAAYIAEVPGVNTQGRTLSEARKNLKDALEMVPDANRELTAL